MSDNRYGCTTEKRALLSCAAPHRSVLASNADLKAETKKSRHDEGACVSRFYFVEGDGAMVGRTRAIWIDL